LNTTRPGTYLALLVRNKWWIAVATILAAVVSVAISLTLDDQYRANARLLVLEPTVESKLSGHQNVNNAVYSVDTYSSMFGNQELLASVVRDLGLDFPPDRLTPGSLRRRVSVVPVKDTKLIDVSVNYNHPVRAKIIVNKVAEEFVGLYNYLRSNEIDSSQRFVREQLNRVNADFDALQDSLRNARKTGRVDELQLRLQHVLEQIKMFQTDLAASRSDLAQTDARLRELTLLLDEIPRETVASSRQINTVLRTGGEEMSPETARTASAFLQELDFGALQRSTTNDEQRFLIDQADQELVAVRAAAGDLENPPGRRRLTPQEWSERYRILTEGLATLVEYMERLDTLLGDEATGLSPMRHRLQSIERAVHGDVSQETVERHKQVNPLRTSLLRDQTEARVAKQGLEAKVNHLESVLSSLRAELGNIQNRLYSGRRDVEALEEESEITAELKGFLTEKYDQSRIEVAAKLGTMTLVDPALTPEKKIGPQRKLNVLLGMLLGFTVSSVAVVGLDFLKQE
jgi:capsular polysaccharide biosynthesis protein